jgi:hypothetical protein
MFSLKEELVHRFRRKVEWNAMIKDSRNFKYGLNVELKNYYQYIGLVR